jgi:hypothetical protein
LQIDPPEFILPAERSPHYAEIEPKQCHPFARRAKSHHRRAKRAEHISDSLVESSCLLKLELPFDSFARDFLHYYLSVIAAPRGTWNDRSLSLVRSQRTGTGFLRIAILPAAVLC